MTGLLGVTQSVTSQPPSWWAKTQLGGFCVALHLYLNIFKHSAEQSLVAVAGTVQGLSMHRGMSLQGSCLQLLWAVGQAGH